MPALTRVRHALLLPALLAACARAGEAPAPAPELQSVWALYIEPVRSTVESSFATAELRKLLQNQPRFVVVETPDQAHAIVRVTIAFQQHDANAGDPSLEGEILRSGSFRGYPPPSASITLLAAEQTNRVIWSRSYVATRSRHRQTNPPPQTIISRVVAQLGGQMLRVAGRRGPLNPAPSEPEGER